MLNNLKKWLKNLTSRFLTFFEKNASLNDELIIPDSLLEVEELWGPYIKIKRASEHIKKVHREMHAFFNNHKNYGISTYFDSHFGDYIIYCQLNRSLPIHWQVLIGEACYNLLSSLDHMVVALAVKNTGVDKWKLYFPIADDREKFRKLISQRHKHPVTGERMLLSQIIGSKALRRIIAMQPYRPSEQRPGRGNNSLFMLKTLRNHDGHNFLIPTIGNAHKLHYWIGRTKWEFITSGSGQRLDSKIYIGKAKNLGISVDQSGRPKPKPKIALGGAIGFGDIEPMKGRYLIPSLNGMT